MLEANGFNTLRVLKSIHGLTHQNHVINIFHSTVGSSPLISILLLSGLSIRLCTSILMTHGHCTKIKVMRTFKNGLNSVAENTLPCHTQVVLSTVLKPCPTSSQHSCFPSAVFYEIYSSFPGMRCILNMTIPNASHTCVYAHTIHTCIFAMKCDFTIIEQVVSPWTQPENSCPIY